MCEFRFSIDLMQMICMDEVVGEKSLGDSIQETTLIHHIFGGRLQSQVLVPRHLSNAGTAVLWLTCPPRVCLVFHGFLSSGSAWSCC
jgi:hypothetical protein